jgi:conjugal transfer/entry exclusion protein
MGSTLLSRTNFPPTPHEDDMNIRKLFAALFVALTALAQTSQSRATGIPVIDVANLAQSVQNVISQARQITEMVRQYQILYDHYKDTIENLKNTDARGLLLGYLMGRDARLGNSFLSNAQYLEPNSPQWRQNVELLLRKHYHLLDKVNGAVAASNAFQPGPGLDRAMAYFENRDRELSPLLDVYHFQATQERAADDRQDRLEALKNSFSGLNDRTALRQAQHTNGLLGLIAQQHEAQIDANHMLLGVLVQEQIQRRSALDRANEAELNRLAQERARPRFVCPQATCMPVW